ncbi:MAG: hypothetical protein Q9M91_03000 [Candidatus Dojkabacteria bacterium]|nr:hypothetical protein [Candidatus Dojkabacteria bacterium]
MTEIKENEVAEVKKSEIVEEKANNVEVEIISENIIEEENVVEENIVEEEVVENIVKEETKPIFTKIQGTNTFRSTEAVEAGTYYIHPDNTYVSIKFNTLPTVEAFLTMEIVTLTDNEIKKNKRSW